MSKLHGSLRAMDAYARHNAPEPVTQQSQDSAVCALADCDEPAFTTCVCCNRGICFYDIDDTHGALNGLCHECLFKCAGGMACKVVN